MRDPMANDKFIQEAVKRPGRVHHYLAKLYGKKAFTERGTIKEEYLDKALERAKKHGETSLEEAIVLAQRLKKIGKERKEAYA